MPKSNIKEQLAKKSNVAKFMFRALVVGVVVTGAYGAWKYPNLFNQVKEWLVSKPEVDVYQQQIDALNAQMDALNYKIQGMDKKTGMALSQLKTPDLAPLYEKITMIEKMNMNVINSKADVATVLGVVTRMDKAEHKLDKLSAVTDDSALILTATMLVKDAAERGKSFEYEAGVLNQIVSDNPKLKKYAEGIEKIAKDGVKTELNLVKSFDVIYANILNEQKEDFDKNWKERLTNKLNEIVRIKKTNADETHFVADKGLEAVKSLVNDGQLYVALSKLDAMTSDEWIKNQKLQEWMNKVRTRQEFYSLINSISAQSLAAMKVKFLKNGN